MKSMTKRKKITIGAVCAAVIILLTASLFAYRHHRIYHDTYILIDNTEYRRDSTSLDLSGGPIMELEKIYELTGLEQLNVRDTGITVQQYEALRAALPDCEILWSVPFQGGYLDNTTTVLEIQTLSEADFTVLDYLPELVRVEAEGCRDYEVLMKLMAEHPALPVSYSVTFSGVEYSNSEEAITVTDPDAGELLEYIQYLPNLNTVNLEGTLPENDALVEVKQAYPDITFIWEFEMFGVTVNTLSEFVDLSNITMESTAAVEDYLPCFYNLSQVDMCFCGIPNEDMDALNKRHEDIKFVWSVYVVSTYIRTDSKFFMPAKQTYGSVTANNTVNLKYCTDMLVMDFGHYGISHIDFVEYMPNLKYLLLCEARISDLTPIGNCTSLEYLEIFMTPVSDYWPLTNLTNLRDLNLAEIPWEDMTPLLQMTWLDRLWFSKNGLSYASQEMMREALPNTVLIFYSSGHTTSGFRYTPRYFEQRDILGMYYGVN